MTSIEWLESELKKSIHYYRLIEDIESKSTVVQYNIFEQAKEMHKQEIIGAISAGYDYNDSGYVRWMGEEYYNETYGSKGNEETFKKD